MNEFWTLVEQARADASSGINAWPPGSAIGQALADRLERLPLERIVEFDQCFLRAAAAAQQWEVCAAAFVIWKYISDDSYTDFVSGLVGLGQDAFERITADPDALADQPMVRAIAAGQVDRFALSGEAIQFAASRAYERRTADADAFWEAVESLTTDDANRGRWSGQFGSAEDAELIPIRLPRLYALMTHA